MKTHHIQRRNHGFTLIELIVSVAIFSIVMFISVGTLLVFIDANAKAQALYNASSNLSLALDTMTREMRAGYHYYCEDMTNLETTNTTLPLPDTDTIANCTGGDFIVFTRESDGYRVGYRRVWVNPAGVNIPIIQKKIMNGISTILEWTPITNTAVSVDIFSVSVRNAVPYIDPMNPPTSTGDIQQAEADISVRANTTNGLRIPTYFNLQTSITERRLDIL